jgi:hypothetical protein
MRDAKPVNRILPIIGIGTLVATLAAAVQGVPGQTMSDDPTAQTETVTPVIDPDTGETAPTAPPPTIAKPMTNEEFLEEWQRRCFAFFWEQADPETGLIADRAPADGSRRGGVASIASVGFGLTAICIADERSWVSPEDAYQRVLTTVRFLEQMPTVHGYYYHFVDSRTGQRVWQCEVSSIDTALLIAGVLTAGQYYADTEVAEIARRIYERVEWPWMLAGGQTLSMGWRPESGFINARWEHYSEHMILHILGLGSPTHPLPAEIWHRWRREPVVQYEGMTFLSYPPLFIHQFTHAWIDFRGVRDDYADYWINSVLATRAQRYMAIHLRERFPHYGENLWGITSSDSEIGYTDWVGPEPIAAFNGTVVPCAAAGSIPFLPQEAIAAVRHMYDAYGDKAWKHYGLVDAFNPHTGWYAGDVIGIDVGITLVMIENHRSGFTWKHFMRIEPVQRGMEIAGFQPYDMPPGEARLTSVLPRRDMTKRRGVARTITVPRVESLIEGEPHQWQQLTREEAGALGGADGDHQLVSARFYFAWDDQALHLKVDVEDERVHGVAPGMDPDKPDQADRSKGTVELFIDPQNDGLAWGDPAEFQFGVSVPNQVWEWFGQRQGAQATVTPTERGYSVEAAIPFDLINVRPEPGQKLSASVALKTPRTDAAPPTVAGITGPVKLNWDWTPDAHRVYLGELKLEDAADRSADAPTDPDR